MSRRKKITDTAAARKLMLRQMKRLDEVAGNTLAMSAVDAEPQCMIADAMSRLAQGIDLLDAQWCGNSEPDEPEGAEVSV